MNTWITTHWIVVHDLDKRLISNLHTTSCKDEYCKIINHNKDLDVKNNSPDNLEAMLTWSAMIQYRGTEPHLRR
jgi:hypothetical protein